MSSIRSEATSLLSHGQSMTARMRRRPLVSWVYSTVYPFDAHIASVWFATQFILWRAKPGAIIVLHDAGACGERTVKTLSSVLPRLRRRCYRIVNLSGLVATANAAS